MKNWQIILLVVLAIVFGFMLGGNTLLSASKDSAVQAGVAEYYLDVDNNKQFRFRECEE